MAKAPKSRHEVADDARKAIQDEATQRLADARQGKSKIESDLQNCYFYAAPRRVRRQGSAGQSTDKPGDDRQLQTSFGFEVVDDFMSMLIETFTPREGPWAERQLPTNPDEDGNEDEEVVELNKLIKAEDKKVFGLIRASNYYAEKAKTGVPDAAIGVVAMTINDPGRGRPIEVLGVPIRELDIDLGPDGRVDFRSITRPTKYRYVRALLGVAISERLPDDCRKKIKDAPNEAVEINWCWWRDWENVGDTVWQHVVLVAGKVVHDGRLVGEGSCPLIVGRFGATPDFAWPDGPLVKSLADLVQLDELRGGLIENVDFTLRPPTSYEDDGVLNIPVDGVQPGDLLPKRPSYGKKAFEKIYESNPIDSAIFETDMLQTRIKRLHYVDVPEQRGKTPPTATQWADELVIRQKRIGTPGYAFWREEPYEAFQRFRYLGEKRGAVKTAQALGVPDDAALQPYNPAERAQDSQDISTALRFAQAGQAIAPTMWQVMLDEAKTLKNLKAKFRDEVIQFRDDEDVKKRIELLQSLASQAAAAQTGGGGEGQGGAPA